MTRLGEVVLLVRVAQLDSVALHGASDVDFGAFFDSLGKDDSNGFVELLVHPVFLAYCDGGTVNIGHFKLGLVSLRGVFEFQGGRHIHLWLSEALKRAVHVNGGHVSEWRNRTFQNGL